MNVQKKLPNATAVLILGILSIFPGCCFGPFGLILGIIGLVLAKKDMDLYSLNPEDYDNYNNLNVGRILSIIGVVIGVIFTLLMIFVDTPASEQDIEQMLEGFM
jgi:uncharacterized membrane protein